MKKEASTFFLTKLALVLVLTISFSCKEKKKKIAVTKTIEKPNIVFIMADDLGYGELSCYGSTIVNTPNIDKLAAEGMRFTDFHSNGPVCSPTRAALMTGKYQQRTGIEGVITAKNHRDVGLSLNEITLAEVLKEQGYTCGMYGKWHLGYKEAFNPIHQGFGSFTGFVSGNIDYNSHVDQEGYLDWWKGNVIDNEEGYTTDLITDYSVAFIKKNNPTKTKKPFFLYIPQEAPHSPIQGRGDAPVRYEGSGKIIRRVPKDSIPIIYKEMIEIMDESVGKVMKTIKEEGISDNTIVIFCSDNGAAGSRGDNGVLRGAKASIYEGGHRVPGIVWYPGKVKAGITNNTPVMTMDFLPTFIDLLGGNIKEEAIIDGVSLKNVLLDNEGLTERNLYWSYANRRAIRKGNWKLVSHLKKDSRINELYNLKADLSEKNDVSVNKPELVQTMLLQLQEWEKEVRAGVTSVSK